MPGRSGSGSNTVNKRSLAPTSRAKRSASAAGGTAAGGGEIGGDENAPKRSTVRYAGRDEHRHLRRAHHVQTGAAAEPALQHTVMLAAKNEEARRALPDHVLQHDRGRPKADRQLRKRAGRAA